MKRLAALLFLCLAAFARPVPGGPLASDTARSAAQGAVADILDALARADFRQLASHVGGEGLVVSPYVMLDSGDVRLSRTEVESCAKDARVRLWGYRDGSGDPIETTCSRYFAEFVWDVDYRRSDELLYNKPRQRGLEPNNNHEFAPDALVVELHIRETPEGMQPYRPWKSLRLVFRRGDQGFALIAITRDVWTI
jgi:hypothetical protein